MGGTGRRRRRRKFDRRQLTGEILQLLPIRQVELLRLQLLQMFSDERSYDLSQLFLPLLWYLSPAGQSLQALPDPDRFLVPHLNF